MSVTVAGVDENSVCFHKGVRAGDELVSINNSPVNDFLDYRFLINDSCLRLLFKRKSGGYNIFMLHKNESDDLGLDFETYLMDKQQSCKNKCIFCFIDQLPKGMRKSLYFKDDDSRLSFLFGNYITLTNLTDEDVDRIIKMHISPVNISVHTMNPSLRVSMMKNPFAGESLKYIKRLAHAGTLLNTQIVCCPGINDGEELEFSLRELYKLRPGVQSIACVPVGLTKYRDNLFELNKYDRFSAGKVIDIIEKINKEFCSDDSEYIAYAADEFYLTAQRPMPEYKKYNGFPQLENGVGMWSLLENEFCEALKNVNAFDRKRKVTLATGSAAFPLIQKLAEMVNDKFKSLSINVVRVENRLFGPDITVSGLLSGEDICLALSGIDIGDELIIPPNCLKKDEDLFIDDMTVAQMSERLNVKVRQNGPSGKELLDCMLGVN
ncbi:MAG: DUF512 domain-containing protein [Clostridiales bacterium]|nr:DUF512 domain-containing protein [Clostridiales bacterium]